MFIIHWFTYNYWGHPWYAGAIWGNVFVAPVVLILAWIWSKTKYWPLAPLNKIYNHVAITLAHTEHQSRLLEELHHLQHTGKLHPRVVERINGGSGHPTPSIDDLLPKSATMQDVAVVNPSKEINKQMPSASQVKQFLVTSVVPLIVGGLVTWLSGTHVFAILHTNASTAAGILTAAAVFVVSALIAFASTHHILKGTYNK